MEAGDDDAVAGRATDVAVASTGMWRGVIDNWDLLTMLDSRLVDPSKYTDFSLRLTASGNTYISVSTTVQNV